MSAFDGQHYVFTADNSQVLQSLQQINGAMQGSQQFAQNAQAQSGGNAATKAFYAQQTATHKAALAEQVAEAKTTYAALNNENKAYWQTQVAQAKQGFSALSAEQKHNYTQAESAQKSSQQIQLAQTKAFGTQQTGYFKTLNSGYLAGIRSYYTQSNATHKAGLAQWLNSQKTADAQIINNQKHTNAILLQQQKHADAVRLAERRAQLAEEARLNRQSSNAGSYIGGGISQAIATIAGGNLVATAITASLRGVAEAFGLVFQAAGAAASAIGSFVSTGLQYSQMIETTTRAIQTLITANYDLKDSSGNVLTGMQEFAAAGGIAAESVEKLRVAALESPLSFQELLLGFQQTAAQASEAGIKIEELVPLTLKLGGAVKTLGLDTRQVQQEIRAILTGRVGPSEQLGRVLGVNNELIKQWKEQGTLVAELSKRLQPFVYGLEDAKKDMDVLSSSTVDLYDNIARLGTTQLFEELKRSLYDILTGLTTSEGALEEPLNSALKVLDDLSGKAGELANIFAEKVVNAIIGISEWIEENKVQILNTGDAAISATLAVTDALGEVLQLVGNILGVNARTLDTVEKENVFLGFIQAVLGTIEGIAHAIQGVFMALNDITQNWVAQLFYAASGLQSIVNLLSRANAEAGAARAAAADAARNQSLVDDANRKARMNSELAQRGLLGPPGGGRKGGGGGGGGKGGGGQDIAEQRDRILRQYALKAEKDTLDSLLGINQDLAKIEFERLQAIQKLAEEAKKYKIAASDVLRITTQINEEANKDTERAIEKNRLLQQDYENNLAIWRLKLDGREVDADILEMDAKKEENYRKLLEIYRVGEQAKIDMLQKQYETMLSQEAVLKRWSAAVKDVLSDMKSIEEVITHMGIDLSAIAQQPLPFETDFDFIEKTREQLRGLTDLTKLSGTEIKGIGDRLKELGTTVEGLATAFGHAASNSTQLYQQMEAMERFGPAMQKMIGTLQEATDQALATAQNLTALAIPNTFSLIGESLGKAFAGVEDFGKAFKEGMLGMLGELASAWGRWFILVGTGNLLFGNPVGAAQIAAGIALTAFGAYLSAKAGGSNASEGGGSSSTSTAGPSSTQSAGPPPIPRRQFNTSGESRFGQPIWFGPDSSYYGGDTAPMAIVEVRVGEGVIMESVVRGVSRGSGRIAMRRKRL